jgi:type IV pilus assembly protein PilA
MWRNNKGVSLVELLVVVVIIGVIAAIAVPIYTNQQKGAEESAMKSDMSSAASFLTTHSAGEPLDIEATVASPTELPGVYAQYGLSGFSRKMLLAVGPNGKDFCISATTNDGTSWFWDSTVGGFTETKPATCANPPVPSTP